MRTLAAGTEALMIDQSQLPTWSNLVSESVEEVEGEDGRSPVVNFASLTVLGDIKLTWTIT